MSKLFLITIFLLVVFLIVRWQWAQNDDFLAQSDITSGIIIRKEEQIRRADQPNRKEYIVSYSYTVGDNGYIGRENFEFEELWADIKEGQAVDINYLRSDPSISHLSMILKLRAKSTSNE